MILVSVLPVSGELSMQGLCNREVLEDPALQCDSHIAQWSRYDHHCSSPLLHWYQAVLIFPRFVLIIDFLYNQYIQSINQYKRFISIDFAKHIVSVSQNDSLFASYFWWRDFYQARPCDHGITCHSSSFTDVSYTVWSTIIGRGMSRLGSHWSRVLLAPALLCHKEPVRSKQNTKPLVGGFGCDELVLYGIRELA